MDNISNLSSNLPPTVPVSEASLQEITNSLTYEFKNAAKSVSSLYKLSIQRNEMVRHQGYLDAVNDLIQVLKNGGDVENWAVLKKLELEGTVKREEPPVEEDEGKEQFPLDKLPSDYDFNIPGHQEKKFPPTNPLLTVQRRKKETLSHKEEAQTKDTLSSEDEDEVQDPYSLENSNKRRYEALKGEKRPKY